MIPYSVTVVVLNVLLLCSLAGATLTESISENYLWDGVAAFIVVDRQVIRDKLEEWHNSSGSNGPRLYLPTCPIFPGILDENQHVLYLDAGYVKFYDFEGVRDEGVSIDGIEIEVAIPFLTDTPSGLPRYSLALFNFYERSRGDVPKANIAFPYVSVDEITREENTVILRNGSEEFQLVFERHTDPCELVNPKVRHEFEGYFDQEFQIGIKEPDFSFCDRHPSENRYCMVGQSIKCELHRSSPNICQTSWATPTRMSCDTPVWIEKVTPRFRNMMLLGIDEINIIATESYYGNFSLGLKYPCLE